MYLNGPNLLYKATSSGLTLTLDVFKYELCWYTKLSLPRLTLTLDVFKYYTIFN